MEEIFKKAREVFGLDEELIKLAEESSELAKAALKLRGRTENPLFITELADEICDVELLIHQMREWFDIEDTIDKIKKSKMKRLETRMNGGWDRR